MKNKNIKTLAICLFGVVFVAKNSISTAIASDQKNNNSAYQISEFNFDMDFYSAMKKKESSFDVSSATYILTSEEIRRSGATSIPEALRMVPGLQVARIDGNKWAISSRGFNRQFSNKLLVMIDGRIIYSPLFSGPFYDIQDYVLEDIDKIEVIRGTGGSIWGYNAINGIINIITKNSAQTSGAYISQIVGDHDKSITEARYGGKIKNGDNYRLYFKNLRSDYLPKYASNMASNQDFNRQTRGGFRYDFNSIKNGSSFISGEYSKGDTGNFLTVNNVVNDKKSESGHINFNLEKNISNRSSVNFTSYLDYAMLDAPVLKYSLTTLNSTFQHFYQFTKNNQFAWGGEYIQFVDNIRSGKSYVAGQEYYPFVYSPSERNDQIFSGFVQDKINLFDDKATVTLGSKMIHNDYTGFDIQPSLHTSFFPGKNQTIWTSVSRVSRIPTRGEDGFTFSVAPNRVAQRGSDKFKNENVVSYEMGYRVKPTRKLMIDSALFYSQYSSLRTFENQSDGSTMVDNYGKGNVGGIEITSKWQAFRNLKVEANYDYLKMDLKSSSKSTDRSLTDKVSDWEGQSPQHQFKLKFLYNPTSQIELDNIAYYVSGLPKADSSDGRKKGIPSYVRFDSRISYLVNSNFDVSFVAQNLLNQEHREFKKGLYNNDIYMGRMLYLKASLRY